MTDRPAENSMDLRAELTKALRLQAAGEVQEAQALCDQLLVTHPQNVAVLASRARMARLDGDGVQAEELLEKAFALAPNSLAVLSELAQAAVAAGRHQDAVRHFTALARLRPEHADAWFNLGLACESCHRHQDAIDAYRKALSLGPQAAGEVLTRLGGVLLVVGREEQALECYERALADHPDNPQALYGKGMIQQTMGDFAAAEDLFRQALDLHPDFVEVYQQIAELRRFSDLQDPLAQRMRALLDGPRSEHAQEKLHFALGKISNDCGEYDAAFGHFAAANALKKKRQPPVDREDYQSISDAVISYFDQSKLSQTRVLEPLPVTPVFIVGMPRSGTTLIEQILSSHTEVSGAGELAFVDALARHSIKDYPRGLDALGDAEINKFRQDYAAELGGQPGTHRYVTDKFPGNFLHLGLINALFPEARLIYCRRDAMDNCLSIFIQDFGTANFYSNDLEDIAFYYRCQQKVMAHWQAMFGERLLQMQYEDVIENQERETRRLLAFLDLEWQDACMAFDKNPRKIATLSRWQVRQPIYKTAVGRWRRYAQHLEPLRHALDYKDQG